MMVFGELVPPTTHLDEQTPNNCIPVIEGNKHSIAFFFADYLEIPLKHGSCHTNDKTKITGHHAQI